MYNLLFNYDLNLYSDKMCYSRTYIKVKLQSNMSKKSGEKCDN